MLADTEGTVCVFLEAVVVEVALLSFLHLAYNNRYHSHRDTSAILGFFLKNKWVACRALLSIDPVVHMGRDADE